MIAGGAGKRFRRAIGFDIIGCGEKHVMHRRQGGGFVADLGEVWHKWTGLPFVFARWMVRSTVPDHERTRLIAMLDGSIADGWLHFERVVSPRAQDLRMTIEEMREYLQGFRFRMTEAEHQAIGKFRQFDAAAREAEGAPAAS